ncbi:cell surface hyaluronidase-like [Haliotis asinina]|uniref:cell surface hyaluronidase-like n=1 Tax=Haliotis asinina TaxID=109174 RepID=UPI0035320E5B
MRTVLLFLVWSSLSCCVFCVCPHQTPGLRRWSHASSWPGNKKPGAQSRVFINDAILLDESPPELHSITIETTGRLVWSPDGDYDLTTQYILIKGRFDVGSDDCKFHRKANITLTGIRGKYRYVMGPHLFGEKFIGVAPGGTLELHGREKLSWTKLTRTLPKLTSSNGLHYDHKTSNHSSDGSWKKGIHAYVMDGRNGHVIDFGSFILGEYNSYYSPRDPTSLAHFINNAKDGNIVLLSVKANLIEPRVNLTPVYEAVETLTDGHMTGNGLIRSVRKGDAYAFIIQKGKPETLDQKIGVNYKLRSQTAKVSLTLWDRRLKFSTSSYIDNKHSYLNSVDFRVVSTQAAYPILSVIDDVSTWQPGDKVIVTSTDYQWTQTEEGTVIKCAKCHHNQVQIDLEPLFTHWGEMVDGVDQRAEVALLTRNIRVEGRMENTCPSSNRNCNKYNYDTFGGHIKFVKGFKDVHIQGVELTHMGQQSEKGFYPIHFHMTHDIDSVGNYSNPAWVRHCSIHHTYSRCVTVHGTHGATVQDNVGYDHLGHCYFLEDGGEKRNVFDGNLGVGTRKGSILPSDDKPATFWMTSPSVYLRNNVAAGGEGVGIWYVYPDEPMGPSFGLGFFQKNEAKHTALLEFNNNVAHSNLQGMFMDGIVEPDETVGDNNHYDAREDPLNTTSPFKEVVLYRLTAYKNQYQNAWIRGGLIRMDHSSFADSGRSLTMARAAADQSLTNSIIIGESRNLGEPSRISLGNNKYTTMPRSIPLPYDPHQPLNGFLFYDGPVYIKNVWFSNFTSNVNYTAGAIGFLRNNEYSSSPSNMATNVKFNFVDGPTTGNRVYDGNETIHGFGNNDGDKTATIRDTDGSLTGYPGATVVKPGAYYHNSRCYTRDNWNMQICPQEFGSLSIRLGSTGDHGKTHPFMIRDDDPAAQMTETWAHSAAFPVTLGGHYSYTLHWSGIVPHEFHIVGEGINRGRWLRFGVCLPRDGKFHIWQFKPVYRDSQSKYDNQHWTELTSVAELEKDTSGTGYFWDKHTGLMFFKMFNNYERFNNETDACPNGCPYIRIQVLSGNLHDGDCSSRAYGPYRRAPVTGGHALHKNTLQATASQPPRDWGAGRTRPFLTRTPVNGHYGQWTGWSHCSNTCGGGSQVRHRACDNKHSSEDCQRPHVEHRMCNTKPCSSTQLLG